MSKLPHARCGAETRSGKPCKNRPMANGRCRLHGGLSPGAPKNNKFAEKHGLYSKLPKGTIPKELQQIIDGTAEQRQSELLWLQIQVHNANMLRSLKLMHVSSEEDHTRIQSARSEGRVKSVSYLVQTASDRQSTFLTAYSRAAGALGTLIKQYEASLDKEASQGLSVALQRAQLDKLKTEVGLMKLTPEEEVETSVESFRKAMGYELTEEDDDQTTA